MSSPFLTPAGRLSAFFDSHDRETYDDAEIDEIAYLLERCTHVGSKFPRTYIVLRKIGELRGLPSFLSPTIKSKFVQSQGVVLTKSLDLEHGRHRHFAPGEALPFDVLGRLGSGGYGQVDRIVSKISFRQYALKRIRRRAAFGNNSKESMKRFFSEIQIVKSLKHKHIVQYIGSYTDKAYLGLVMSPVADADLAGFMQQTCVYIKTASATNGAASTRWFQDQALAAEMCSTLRTYFGCLAAALAYLHDQCIRHKDIKPQNILVHKGNILLTDFGLSRDFADDIGSTTSGITPASPRYSPPEVAAYEARNTSADIWALGCVFFEMVAALHGFDVEWVKHYFVTVHTMSSHFYTNPEASSQLIQDWEVTWTARDQKPLRWIKSMLQINRLSRPTAAQVLELISSPDELDQSPSTFCGICCVYDEETDSDDSLVDEPTILAAASQKASRLPKHYPTEDVSDARFNEQDHKTAEPTLTISRSTKTTSNDSREDQRTANLQSHLRHVRDSITSNSFTSNLPHQYSSFLGSKGKHPTVDSVSFNKTKEEPNRVILGPRERSDNPLHKNSDSLQSSRSELESTTAENPSRQPGPKIYSRDSIERLRTDGTEIIEETTRSNRPVATFERKKTESPPNVRLDPVVPSVLNKPLQDPDEEPKLSSQSLYAHIKARSMVEMEDKTPFSGARRNDLDSGIMNRRRGVYTLDVSGPEEQQPSDRTAVPISHSFAGSNSNLSLHRRGSDPSDSKGEDIYGISTTEIPSDTSDIREPQTSSPASEMETKESKHKSTNWFSSLIKKNRKTKKHPPTETSTQKVFGVSLLSSIETARCAISLFDEAGDRYRHGYIPIVVAKCGVFLKERGTNTMGALTIIGYEDHVRELITTFQTPPRYGRGVDWAGYNVFDAATTLHRYLASLSDPLIMKRIASRMMFPPMSAPFRHPYPFEVGTLVTTFQSGIKELPLLHRHLTLYLLDLFALFETYSALNGATTDHIVEKYYTIFFDPAEDDLEISMRQRFALGFLIEHHISFVRGVEELGDLKE
jgi:serine/threonine protein kinase